MTIEEARALYESGFNSGLERGADGGSFEAALLDLGITATGENTVTNATGPWVAVTEREPENRKVVLGRWRDGAVRMVEWSPRSHEGKPEGGHRPGDGPIPFSIYLAHTAGFAVGFREWPIEWAEIYP